ncbi:ComGF family competence protein [Sharpea azabuensis]|nr:ComGF family competence protein [Sharpea azabuensis]MEE3307644.1 ComGF family competence protein [Sharpea azabuensis]
MPEVKIDSDLSIGTKQLSDYLMTAKIESYHNGIVYKDKDGKEFHIELSDHRLVKTPGYETLLYDVDDVAFFENNRFLLMKVRRGKREYRYLIADLYEKSEKENEEEKQEGQTEQSTR